MDQSQINIQKAKDHPFRVIQVKDGDKDYLLLDSRERVPHVAGPELHHWTAISVIVSVAFSVRSLASF